MTTTLLISRILYGLCNLFQDPTCFKSVNTRCIDLLLTNNVKCFKGTRIDHFPVGKEAFRRARSIPTALTTVGNPGNPLCLIQQMSCTVRSNHSTHLNTLMLISLSKIYVVLF